MAAPKQEILSAVKALSGDDKVAAVRAAAKLHESARSDSKGTQRVLLDALGPRPPEAKPAQPMFELHNVHMPWPYEVLKPKDAEDLQRAMVRAVEAWRPIRAAGSGCSFSNIAFTDGFFLQLPPHMKRVFEADERVLRTPGGPEKLVRFQAGATITDINDYLTRHGLAFWQQPAYGGLSYVGSMVAGGHGSGVTLGPIAAYVRSLRVFTVDPNHKVVDLCIEPRNGITDPAKWRQEHPNVTLHQDDDLFFSMVVSAGCLGVIHEVTIAVRSAFKLREERTKASWKDVKDVVNGLVLHPPPPAEKLHSVSLFVNPYAVGDDHHCVLAKYFFTDDKVDDRRGIGLILGGTQPLVDIVWLIARLDPAGIPALIDGALESTEGISTLPSTVALDQGSPNDIPVLACASGVGVDRWIEATEAVFALLKKRAEEKEPHYVESPMGLRFVQKADAYLAPSYGRDTCMIETPCMRGTPGSMKTLDAIHGMLADKYGGRPHWGQVNQLGAKDLQALFPKFMEFANAFAVLNPRGFFDNAFTQQLGL